MAHIYRLIVLVFLCLLSNASFAVIPKHTTKWFCTYTPVGQKEGNCSACGLEMGPVIGTDWYYCKSNDGSLVGQTWKESVPSYCPQNSSESGSGCACNTGFEENDGACKPVSSPLEEACRDFKGHPWADMESQRKYSETPNSFQACAREPLWPPDAFPGKGCVYDVEKEWGAQSRSDGKYYTYGRGVSAGVPCDLGDGADPEKKEAKNPDCPSGQPGFVNGVKVCVPYLPESIYRRKTEDKNTKTTCSGGTCTTTTTTKTTSSEKPVFDSSSPNQGGSDGTGSGVPRTYGWKEGGSGGSAGKDIPAPGSLADGWDADKPVETQRETTKEQTKNADGSLGPVKVTERTSSSQVGADGKVTTATETRSWYEDSSGNRVGDIKNESGEVNREDKKTFCEENPRLSICRDSAFSGACGVDFKCDGDAIQCAIVREQHNRNCKLFDLKSTESELYEKEKNKEGDQTKELPGNESIDMNNRIKTDDLLGAGGGIMDLNVTVWGRSISLPLSQLNAAIQYLGNILIAVAMLAAVRIVGGR